MESRLVCGLRNTGTHTAQAHVFPALAQFRDCYDNQHKSEALVTNKL